MVNEIPAALEAYHPGVVHVCCRCGCSVVDAVVTPDKPFYCVHCQDLLPAPEDELTRVAMEDPGTYDVPDDRPTVWRFIVVITFAVIALAIVFWKR
jgi:hypothetical protein